ncbi:4-coumarate-CoA ligase [Acrasis kona]|uniref:4-coumarate-CoA ligase n=1 Tax=Acrasis kona TaxID=1008807 RepID=A0AAW2Z4K7_9EUKA
MSNVTELLKKHALDPNRKDKEAIYFPTPTFNHTNTIAVGLIIATPVTLLISGKLALALLCIGLAIIVANLLKKGEVGYMPPYSHYTFTDIHEMSDSVQSQLLKISQAQKRALLLTPIQMPELFPLANGIMRAGMQMVVLGPHETGYTQFAKWLSRLSLDVVIATPVTFFIVKLLCLVVNFSQGLPTKKVVYVIGKVDSLSYLFYFINRVLFFKHEYYIIDVYNKDYKKSPAIDYHLYKDDDITTLTNTTGSTGNPKVVHITHGMVMSQVESFSELVSDYIVPSQQQSCLCTNIVMTICINCMGLTSIAPPLNVTKLGDMDPVAYMRSVDRFQPIFAFCSPIVWNKVIEHCRKTGKKLSPPMQMLLCGGAPVNIAQHKHLRQYCSDDSKITRKVELMTPYGATEGLPLCHIRTSEILALEYSGVGGVCVGRPVTATTLELGWSVEYPITKSRKRHQIAEIWVSGKNVSPSYELDEESNKKFKYVDPQGKRWHCTGDLGYLDEQDRVWFCGRRSHMFTLANKGKEHMVYPVCMEQVFLHHFGEDIRRCAIIGKGSLEGKGEHNSPKFKSVLLVVELYVGSKITADDILTCYNDNMLQHWKDVTSDCFNCIISDKPLMVDKRHNSKIERIKITELYNSSA